MQLPAFLPKALHFNLAVESDHTEDEASGEGASTLQALYEREEARVNDPNADEDKRLVVHHSSAARFDLNDKAIATVGVPPRAGRERGGGRGVTRTVAIIMLHGVSILARFVCLNVVVVSMLPSCKSCVLVAVVVVLAVLSRTRRGWGRRRLQLAASWTIVSTATWMRWPHDEDAKHLSRFHHESEDAFKQGVRVEQACPA